MGSVALTSYIWRHNRIPNWKELVAWLHSESANWILAITLTSALHNLINSLRLLNCSGKGSRQYGWKGFGVSTGQVDKSM